MAKQTGIEDFDAFFLQYKNWIYKIAYLIIGDPNIAEDIMQEVFINVYKSKESFDSEKGDYTRWLRRITINECLKDGRKKAVSSYSVEEMEEKGYNLPDNSLPLPEQLSLKNDIQYLVNSLSIKYRAALILRCVDGLNYSEIAEALGIPLGTVKSRINRAILALRERQKEIEKGGL
ncbi:RNA polymerase sigma factor [Chloroflexota bacterium]